MDKKDVGRRERRTVELCELRADEDDRKIRGYAAVFNEEANLGMFREVIEPGAFKRAIKEKQDVRALWNHDSNHVLGRTASGTLALAEDDHGLRAEITPPNTQLGRDIIESIERGDVSQMSFAFSVVEELWNEGDDEKLPLRSLRDLDLYDISPVTYPAYEGTSVGLRDAQSVYQQFLDSRGTQVPVTEDDDTDTQVRARQIRRLEIAQLESNTED